MSIWILKNFLMQKKNNQIKFNEIKNKQNEFLNKLSNKKIGKKSSTTKRSD